MTRATLLKSFDSRDTIILPSRESGKDADYVYPPEQARRVETLAERLGIGARDVNGSNGTPILLVYHIPRAHLPTASEPLANQAFASQFTHPSLESGGDFAGRIRVLGANVALRSDAAEQAYGDACNASARANCKRIYIFDKGARSNEGRGRATRQDARQQ